MSETVYHKGHKVFTQETLRLKKTVSVLCGFLVFFVVKKTFTTAPFFLKVKQNYLFGNASLTTSWRP